jgi:hypothetical protein
VQRQHFSQREADRVDSNTLEQLGAIGHDVFWRNSNEIWRDKVHHYGAILDIAPLSAPTPSLGILQSTQGVVHLLIEFRQALRCLHLARQGVAD